MDLTLELNDQEALRLQAQAAELGVTPEQLARSVLMDLLVESEEEFRAAAERVISHNHELYKRLS
ncbi:MAG: DNA-binding protein [Candidatus Handelsmanbacteria bacterium]|nr:DNA-binding protein [Candidatus Handelsmanbacteria bacterium]